MRKLIISAVLASAAVFAALPAAAQPGYGGYDYRGGYDNRGGYGGDYNYGRGGRGANTGRYDQAFIQIEQAFQRQIRNRSLSARQIDKVDGELRRAREVYWRHQNEGRFDQRAQQDIEGWIDRLQRLLHIGRYNDNRRY